jgi:hypothetical protein
VKRGEKRLDPEVRRLLDFLVGFTVGGLFCVGLPAPWSWLVPAGLSALALVALIALTAYDVAARAWRKLGRRIE